MYATNRLDIRFYKGRNVTDLLQSGAYLNNIILLEAELAHTQIVVMAFT